MNYNIKEELSKVHPSDINQIYTILREYGVSEEYIKETPKSNIKSLVTKTKNGTSDILVYLNRHNTIRSMYLAEGRGAEYITKTIFDQYDSVSFEKVRKIIKNIMKLERMPEQEHIAKHSHYEHVRGENNPRYRTDVWAEQNTLVEAYANGTSSEDLAISYRCDPSLIMDILRFNNAVTPEARYEVSKNTTAKRASQWDSMTEKQKKAITDKRRKSTTPEAMRSGRKKAIKTLQERYSDPSIINCTQVEEVHKKSQRYRYKEYVTSTGDTVNVQGYENVVLSYLESKGLIVGKDIILRGRLDYVNLFTNTSHKYFPDIGLAFDESFIEVKSVWTLKKYWKKNVSIMKEHENVLDIYVCNDKEIIHVIGSFDELITWMKNNLPNDMLGELVTIL